MISPHTLELTWLAPEEKHSDELRYEVHWSSEGYEGGNKINKQLEVSELGVRLSDRSPGQEYSLWVVATHTDDSKHWRGGHRPPLASRSSHGASKGFANLLAG